MNNHKYKPRYTIAYATKAKVWPYKNSYLRGFYSIRARRRKRLGFFRRCVMVATSMKWVEARRFIRPFIKSSSTSTNLTSGKTAFGRPSSFKLRYRSMFYRKQQLRFFHGKIKEESFRIMFKNHLITVANRTNSFYSVLESRLDRIFFRRRLLPTVYACHQFIHHQGLEVNNRIEKSPRAQVRIGDRIAVPINSWKSFYWDVFYRIYFRRWGMYVMRCRLYNQIKKKLSLLRYPNVAQKRAPIIFKNNLKQRRPLQRELNSKKKVKLSGIKPFNTIFKNNPRLFRPFDVNVIQKKLNYNLINQTNLYSQRLTSFTRITTSLNRKRLENSSKEKYETLINKLQLYQKLYFSLRIRKNFLPYLTRFSNKNLENKFSYYQNAYKRKKLFRFKLKQTKKKLRYNKIVRLNPVHFFIPSYIQMDFRTLRAIKVQSPSPDELFYPFRISLSKTYAFYHAKGF